MNERRTLIDTKLKEVNRLVNSGSFVNIVEASKILEQVMDPAQKLYYHTGLIVIVKPYFCVIHIMLT